MTRPLASRDPLAPLLVPPPVSGSRGMQVSLRTGTVVTWNASTGASTIRVDGVDINDLPVLESVNFAGVAPGDQVAILVTRDSGGTATYAVLGRFAVPDLSTAPAVTEGGHRYLRTVYFVSSGTFEPDAYPGLRAVGIHTIGGGGAGGGAETASSGQSSVGGGGGGGGYARRLLTVAELGASQAVTIGAGGAGSSGAAGGTGGTTSVGSLCSATGGAGGSVRVNTANAFGAAGGAGGAGSAGDFLSTGGPGGMAWGDTSLAISGPGGTSYLGGGAFGIRTQSVNVAITGNAGGNYGGGGSGAITSSTGTAKAGGAGGPGVALFDLYV